MWSDLDASPDCDVCDWEVGIDRPCPPAMLVGYVYQRHVARPASEPHYYYWPYFVVPLPRWLHVQKGHSGCLLIFVAGYALFQFLLGYRQICSRRRLFEIPVRPINALGSKTCHGSKRRFSADITCFTGAGWAPRTIAFSLKCWMRFQQYKE